MKTTRILAAAAAMMLSAGAQAQIVDGSFEAQAGASIGTSGYCYIGSTCSSSTPWSSNGGGGFIGVSDGAWPGAQGDGNYHAFIQGGGTLAQTFTATNTGLFTLNWLDAGRTAGGFNGAHAYGVTLNGTQIGSGLTSGASNPGFGARTSSLFSLTAGQSYTLSFDGVANGDTTSFIDGVGLAAAVPEPATWGMMILGFGMAGYGLRRRRSPARTTVRFA